MRKRHIVIAIFILLIVVAVLQNAYLGNTAAEMTRLIDDAEKCDSDAVQKVSALTSFWENRAGFLAALTDHGELDDISELLIRLKSAAISGDLTAYTECIAVLKLKSEHIASYDSINIKNIL